MNRQETKDDAASGRDYVAYLVRLWRVGHGTEARWRGSLQRPGAEEPIWFADLEDLLVFLRAKTGQGGWSDLEDRTSPSQG